ncbi:MAG: EAL domain-containing protein [Spirochaetaceae bacterium]|nr:EAL domain-containing protein [Spirochaetaceae bacterium]
MNTLEISYDAVLRLSFDVLSLLFSVSVLVYTVRIRTLATFRNRIFLVYVLTVLTMCFLDLVQFIFLRLLPRVTMLHLVLDCLYYSLVVFISVEFLIYVFALVDYFQMVKDENKNMLPFRIFFPIAVGMFVIWASVFYPDTSKVFEYIDSFGALKLSFIAPVKGLLGYIVEFAIAYYYIMFGVITMVQHKYRLEKHAFVLMIIVFLSLNAAIITQLLNPNFRIEPLAFSFSLVMFSLFVQKPEYLRSSKTEVLNSKAFDVMVSDYLLHEYSFKVILLYMEDFVFFTDILGQGEFNEFEVSIVRKLRTMFRDTPILRDNSPGFYYLLLKNASDADVEEALDAINEQIEDRWGYRGLKFDFTFRICVVDGEKDIKSTTDLRTLANVFTRQNKYKGQIIRADELDYATVQRCSSAENALLNETFENLVDVMYQPIFSVSEKRITRAESIMCFKDDPSFIVTTDTFLPVFEKTGRFFNINAYAFNSVCRILAQENFFSYGIEKMGINISIIDSTQQDLFEQIKNRLEYYNVSPSLIHFEIIQSSYTNPPDIIVKNLQKLSGYGVEIVLDNFGLGNSNVSQFLRLPLGMIKIDAEVVGNAWGNAKIGIALKSMVRMAHELGIQVIANGVQTVEQRIWLEGIGCDYLQGNLFSKPLPEAEFIKYMENAAKNLAVGGFSPE